MNYKYFEILLNKAIKCSKTGDVPVAACVVKNNKILSIGINSRNKKYSTINHAEIIAIQKANKKEKNCFLYDCDLYVTLKPCEMCEKVINNCRISNVYFLLDKPSSKHEYKKTKYIKTDNKLTEKYSEILRNFFNKLR